MIPHFRKKLNSLHQVLKNPEESQARHLVEQLIRLYQAGILYQKSPSGIAEAYFKHTEETTRLLGTLTDTHVYRSAIRTRLGFLKM